MRRRRRRGRRRRRDGHRLGRAPGREPRALRRRAGHPIREGHLAARGLRAFGVRAQARRRAASASAIIGVGDASIMDEDAGTVWRGGDSYFRNSDWLFHRVARGDEGTLGAGLSSQPPKLPDGLQGIVLGIGLAMASSVPKLRSRRISCGLSARASVMSVMMSWFSRDDARGGVPASSGSSTRRIVAVVRGRWGCGGSPGPCRWRGPLGALLA